MNITIAVLILLLIVNVSHPIILKFALASHNQYILAFAASLPWIGTLMYPAYKEFQDTSSFKLTHGFLLFAVALGIVGGMGTLTYYYSMKNAPAYLVIAIREGAPAITLILTILIFREKIQPIQWLFIGCILFGIMGLMATHFQKVGG